MPTPYSPTPSVPTPYSPTPSVPTPYYSPTPYSPTPSVPTPYSPTPYYGGGGGSVKGGMKDIGSYNIDFFINGEANSYISQEEFE